MRSRPVKHVLEMAHDLDLFRCYSEEKMTRKLESIAIDVGPAARDRLARQAEAAIRATGDRITYSCVSGSGQRYVPGIFLKCSQGPKACWEAIQVAGGTLNASEAVASSPSPPIRTFESSNYKRLYEAQETPRRSHEVLSALDRLISAYCTHTGSKPEDGETLYKALEAVVMKKSNELIHEVAHAAERLWSSCDRLGGEMSKGPELCTIINHSIRADDPELLAPLVVLARSIASLVVTRNIREEEDICLPPNGVTYRGGLLPDEFKSFFTVGKKYATPGFLATSFSEKVAKKFMQRAFRSKNGKIPAVRWTIHVNPEGETDATELCQNANLLKISEVPSESEYLFIPYSVFTILSCEWSAKATPNNPHRISIEAAQDNLCEEQDHPLSPWY